MPDPTGTGAEERRWTLFECKNNAAWNRDNPEWAARDPAPALVTMRCGEAAQNVACDCEPVEMAPASDLAALQERLDRQGYHGFSCQDEFQAWLDAGSPAQWEWTNPLQERLEEERLSPEEARAVLAVCEIIESREGEPIPWPPSMASALAKLTRLSQSVEGR
jgi:hypothetical protein